MILVTGATGTVGSAVVRQLSARGERIRALVRPAREHRAALPDGVEVLSGDYDRPTSLRSAFEGVDSVFLLTPMGPGQVAREAALRTAALEGGVAHVVKLSVAGADPASTVGIARWHGLGEHGLADTGIPTTLLRPASFMQNLYGLVRDGSMTTATGTGRVAMIDVRDIAASAVTALLDRDHHAGRTYHLTGPAAISFGDAAEALSAATGRRITHTAIGADAFRAALLTGGAPGWLADDMAAMHQAIRAGQAATVTSDVTEVTGREPADIHAFAADYAQQSRAD